MGRGGRERGGGREVGRLQWPEEWRETRACGREGESWRGSWLDRRGAPQREREGGREGEKGNRGRRYVIKQRKERGSLQGDVFRWIVARAHFIGEGERERERKGEREREGE